MSVTKKIQTSSILELKSGSHVLVDSLQLTNALPVAQGGTGTVNAGNARTALGLAIGSDVQAYHAKLGDLSGMAPSSGQYVKWDGANFVADTPAGTGYDADEATLHEADNVFSIKDGGVGASQLASSAVEEAKINAGAVTAGKLGANAVTSAKLHSSVASTGILFNSGALQVDSAAVAMLSGAQTIADAKTFSAQPILRAGLKEQESGQIGYSICKEFEAQSEDATVFSLASVTVPADCSVYFKCDIAVASDDLADVAAYSLNGLVKNVAGTVSAMQLNNSIIFESNAAFHAVLDVSGADVRVRCTGVAAKSLRWHASVKYVFCGKYTGA